MQLSSLAELLLYYNRISQPEEVKELKVTCNIPRFPPRPCSSSIHRDNTCYCQNCSALRTLDLRLNPLTRSATYRRYETPVPELPLRRTPGHTLPLYSAACFKNCHSCRGSTSVTSRGPNAQRSRQCRRPTVQGLPGRPATAAATTATVATAATVVPPLSAHNGRVGPRLPAAPAAAAY